MNTSDLFSLMKVTLANLRRRLDEEQRMAADNARTVTLDQSSVGRLSRMDAMQQQAMAQATVQRLHVKRRRVDAALQRIDHGSYGICCECGGAVGLERLLADPATPFCMDCQTDRDAEREAAR